MKKLFCFLLLLTAVAITSYEAQAQLKIRSNGQVSLGSLTSEYGLQVHPSGKSYFHVTDSEPYSYVEVSYSNHNHQKHWVVSNLTGTGSCAHTFYVYGNGWVSSNRSLQQADSSLQMESDTIDGAGNVIDQITGIWYIPSEGEVQTNKEINRRIGVSAQEVEKVLPEAVSADENGLMYVDYEALTVFLIEAVKEQRREVEALRKLLEDNGLMDSQKR